MKIIRVTDERTARETATGRHIELDDCGLVHDGVAEALVAREDAEVVEDFATIGYQCARSAAAYFEGTPDEQDEETLVGFLEAELGEGGE